MPRLTQVFLTTSDLENARGFYEDALGLEPRRVGDTSVTYETGNAALKIQQDFQPETFREYGLEVPDEGRGEGAVYVVDLDEGLEEVYRRCRDSTHAEVLTEPREVEWSERMFLVRSPAGYVFEIRQN